VSRAPLIWKKNREKIQELHTDAWLRNVTRNCDSIHIAILVSTGDLVLRKTLSTQQRLFLYNDVLFKRIGSTFGGFDNLWNLFLMAVTVTVTVAVTVTVTVAVTVAVTVRMASVGIVASRVAVFWKKNQKSQRIIRDTNFLVK
jgi:hypothetical protein